MGRGKESTFIEFTLFEDMVEYPEAKSLLGQMGISGTKKYSKEIPECISCGSNEIVPLEILGAHKGPLFWDCVECGHTHLRFTRPYTERLLRKASLLWTNPNDWGDTSALEN